MKKILWTTLLIIPLAFALENEALSDEELQASKEFQAQISLPFVINALDSMDKCAHYHLALLNVMNAFDPKINSIQGYTTEVINQRIEDYLALIIKMRKELTWIKGKRSMKDDVLLYVEMIFTNLEKEETLKNIEAEIVMCKNIETFIKTSTG